MFSWPVTRSLPTRLIAGLLAGAIVAGGSTGGSAVLSATPSATATPPARPPVLATPGPLAGARSLGDPFYPTLGNGGYDTVAVDLAIAWSAPDAEHQAGSAEVTTALDLEATQDLSELTLDLAARTVRVRSVLVDGASVEFRQDPSDRKLTVILPATRAAGSAFRVEVESSAVPGPVPRTGEDVSFRSPGQSLAESRIRSGRGLIADGDGGMLLAAQPNGAHTLYPVNDHPLDKATYTISLTAPPGMSGIATGTLAAMRTAPDGSLTTTWVSEQRVASHVVALGIGDRVLRSGPVVDGVTYRSAIPTDADPIAGEILGELPAIVGWLEDTIGRPFPFQAFGLLAYRGRPTTAILEGQTLVLVPATVFGPFADHCRILGTLVHEAAHQWFGDDVSIERWDEKWLSEGAATYLEWRWLAEHGCLDGEVGPAADTGAPAAGPAGRTGLGGAAASPGAAPSIVPATALEARVRRAYAAAGAIRSASGAPSAITDPAAAYTPAIYDQGALALHALRLEIGERAFRRVERALAGRFAGGGITTDGFIELASRIARRDLGDFLASWLRGPAVPPMPRHPEWTTDRPDASPSSAPIEGSPPGDGPEG